jgi:hypothetical protein
LSTNAPVLATRLTTEYLSERVETRHYHTDHTLTNLGCWLGAAALPLVVAVAVNDWSDHLDASGGKTWGRSKNIAFGSYLVLGVGLYLGIPHLDSFPLRPRDWTKKVVLRTDTSYQSGARVSLRSVVVSRADGGNGRDLQTTEDGVLNVDIRDFYVGLPADSALRLAATWSGLSAFIVVPPEYVRVARQNESDASALLVQADAAEAESKDELALALYDSLSHAYANTRPASEASVKAGALRAGVNQARIAQARRDFERVSQEKVQGAIGKLNLSSAESNLFAEAIQNLSEDDAASVMEVGLGLLLPDSDCAQEYGQLTLFQKFYALLRYKDAVGTEARSRLAAILTTAALSLAADDGYGLATKLGTNMPIVNRLDSIDPGAVLK